MRPLLVVDSNGGLKNALRRWEGARVQRCTTHKLENLKEHCPQHARRGMKRDLDKIVYAHDSLATTQASFGTEDAALTVLHGLVTFRADRTAEDPWPRTAAIVSRKRWQKVW